MTLSMDRYLSLCGEIEKTMAQIYSLISTAQGMDDVARKVWIQMKLEEDDHFAQIEMLRRLFKSSGNGEQALETEYVERMLAQVKRSHERIAAGGVELPEAIEIAIQLEANFKDFHAGQASCLEDPGLERMFANLSIQDHAHVLRLKKLYTRLYDEQGHMTN